MRVGIGYDVHALAVGRPLIVGGVTIAHEKGLAGHSDADVLTHAIIDALLGACALGDIGAHYPDTDPRYRGADSLMLLADAVQCVHAAGFRVGNIDAVICAQRPKMAPHIEAMRANLAAVLKTELGAVSVKATTTERLGFVGREEGISAYAVVSVEEL